MKRWMRWSNGSTDQAASVEQVFDASGSALDDVIAAFKAGDEIAVRAVCEEISCRITDELPAVLPTPDPDLTRALQALIDDGNELRWTSRELADPLTRRAEGNPAGPFWRSRVEPPHGGIDLRARLPRFSIRPVRLKLEHPGARHEQGGLRFVVIAVAIPDAAAWITAARANGSSTGHGSPGGTAGPPASRYDCRGTWSSRRRG